MKLKICGLTKEENIVQLLECKPDFIGFIFYEKSPRFAGRIVSSSFIQDIPEETKKVGVFVNASFDVIEKRVRHFSLAYVQLHGDESLIFCASIKELGVGVIKVFRVDERFDFSIVNSFSSVCDFFLFDTKTKDYGGSGEQFDWRLLNDKQFERPVFLSGGIALADVGRICRELPDVYAIDINSRFEIAPGIKDIQQIRTAKQLLEKQYGTEL